MADEDASGAGAWHYVTAAADVDPGERAIVEVEGREIAVFNVDGGYHGLANYCVHMGGPVCEGMISGMFTADEDGRMVYDREDEIVSCPWHGWEFDITSGAHLASSNYRLPTYEVEERDGDLYVRL
jgi:nitrite reductase/ring-hydroxylating ferredoxin subunit